MLFERKLVAKYVMGAAVPYVILSATLLTAILFAQQSERFAELALYTQIPVSLFGQIEIALIPNVLVFTLPMAVLAGTIIGFARMGSDSEIVAMRAAGIGTWSMLWPILLMGMILTAATTYINMKEAPQAARGLRKDPALRDLREGWRQGRRHLGQGFHLRAAARWLDTHSYRSLWKN